MANEKKHIAHVKSGQTIINGNGVTEPKLPTAEDIVLGELAVNYAAGYERISLKNSDGNIVPFVSKAYVDSKADGGGGVTNVAYDSTNKKITKTVGGSTTTDVVTAAKIVSDGGGITTLPGGDITGTPGAGKTFTAFSQTNGQVKATIGDISIKKSQVSDLGTIGGAAAKSVDTTISDGSTSQNVPTSSAVASFVEGKGYVTTDTNTTYTFAEGTTNGAFNVTPSGSSVQSVKVHGLGTAAYANTNDFLAATGKAVSATVADSANSVALANVSDAADLKAIEALTGTTGLLKKTAANKWVLDTTAYTTNTGTVTSVAVKMNGTTKGTVTTSGTIDLGTVITDISSKVDKVSGKGLSTNDYTTDEKDKLSGIASGAEVNQNTFSNVDVKVGNTTTTVAADTKTDTITLIQGSNITLTPDATNSTLTIAAEDTTYSEATTTTAGLMSADDKTKLNGIAAGAGVNVQSDWDATSGDAFIKNKPTIPAAQINSDWNATSGVAQILNKPTIPDSFQWYGTSSTAAATLQKKVSIPSITSLKTGQIIVVQPTVTSTVANSTLKLNDFDAYPMRYNNAAITTSTNSIVWSANFPSIWIFDGNYWVFAGHGFDTTYPSMSVAEGNAGTATSERTITAANLKKIIDARGYTTNTGTVTSVRMTVPTGLTVTGSPITTNGTLAITLSNGYVIPQQTTLNSFLKGTIEVVSVTTDNNSYDPGTIAEGTQKHVIFRNDTGTVDCIVTLSTHYNSPDGQPIELTVPIEGYAEANFMNIGGTIYARGL